MLQHGADENTLLIAPTFGPLKYNLKHAKKLSIQKKRLYIHLEDLMGLYVNTFITEIKSPLTHKCWGGGKHT